MTVVNFPPKGTSETIQKVVLVVDDDPAQRMQVGNFLERQGISVEYADNGRTALEAMRRLRPALVLFDVRMPDMDGLEAARQAAELPEAPKIILMSGYDDYVVKANREKLGVFAVIHKPIPLKVLKRFVEEVFLKLGPSSDTDQGR